METSLIFGIMIIIEGIFCMKSEKYFISKNSMNKILPQYKKEYAFKTGLIIIYVGIFIIAMGYLNSYGILLGTQGIICYIVVGISIFSYGKYIHNKYSSK